MITNAPAPTQSLDREIFEGRAAFVGTTATEIAVSRAELHSALVTRSGKYERCDGGSG